MLTKSDDRQGKWLGWHLLLIVLLKIAILYGLWSVFIQPNKVKVQEKDVDCLYSSVAQCARPVSNQVVQDSQPINQSSQEVKP